MEWQIQGVKIQLKELEDSVLGDNPLLFIDGTLFADLLKADQGMKKIGNRELINKKDEVLERPLRKKNLKISDNMDDGSFFNPFLMDEPKSSHQADNEDIYTDELLKSGGRSFDD